MLKSGDKEGVGSKPQVLCASSYPIVSVVSGQPQANGRDRYRRRLRGFKLSYRWRWFGNKAMLVVLLWSFSAFTLFNYVVTKHIESNGRVEHQLRYCLLVSLGAMLCPVLGWLSDAYIGRYIVIKASVIVMWITAVLLCLDFVVFNFYPKTLPLETVVTILLCLGLGAFQVNILQFCIDQLQDASSDEIVSFIVWYVWTYLLAKMIVYLLLCIQSWYGQALVGFCLSVLPTLSVCADALCNHWFNKEPVTPNPLKLIFKVLRYVAKNKYPQLRSAFMYLYVKHSSRINFAKMKYGGPFTISQVEDVKTFFRILVILGIGFLFLAMTLFFGRENYLFLSSCNFLTEHSIFCASHQRPAAECAKTLSLSHAGYILVVLSIPLYEFVVLPLFKKWLADVRILTWLVFGALLLTLHLFCLAALEGLGEFGPSMFRVNETNFTCRDYTLRLPPGGCSSTLDRSYYVLAVLSSVHVLGQSLVLIAGLEFVCAQAPYSMKGIIFGFVYTFFGLSLALLELVFLPFHRTVISVSGEVVGCVFWFLLVCVLCTLVLGVILAVVSRCYKNRERDEDPDD